MKAPSKLLLLITSTLLLLSLISCSANPADLSQTPPPEVTSDPDATNTNPVLVSVDSEVQRAVESGFVPDDLNAGFDQTITFAEYTRLLENFITLQDTELVQSWLDLTEKAAASDDLMMREDGMLELFFAAEILGADRFNSDWGIDNNRLGEKVWDEFAWDYPLFPKWTDKKRLQEEWDNYMIAAYFYSFGRISLLSGKPIFDIDETIPSMRVSQPFTRAEAIRSVLRLYESIAEEYKRIPTDFDRDFLAAVEERKAAILTSPTTVTISGTSYFVSNTGNDENDGLSAETAWATLDKVNQAPLAQGDGVFFERGGLWRGQLRAKEGVTYSAYGTGIKPAIYGSHENSADPEKWSLLEGTQNIWVYYKELTDVGTLVFNEGEEWAIRETPSFVNGKFVLREDKSVEFDLIKELDQNLEFFSEVDAYLVDGAPYRPGMESVEDNVGTLYLRSENGNPGALYDSIEILTRNYIVIPADNTIFDNLTIKYTGQHALSSWGNRITVQNCEFGWIGGSIQYYDPETNDPGRLGNAIESDGSYDSFKVLNNYIYQVFDAGASNQETDKNHNGHTIMQNIVYSGNIMEYCTYGIEIFLDVGEADPNVHFLKNLLIDNNYILYTGFGWGNQRPDFGTPSSIQLWTYPNASENFVIQNNVLYLSKERLLDNGSELQWMPKLSGNTYVQTSDGMLGTWTNPDGIGWNDHYIYMANIDEILRDVFGDKTGVVIPPHFE